MPLALQPGSQYQPFGRHLRSRGPTAPPYLLLHTRQSVVQSVAAQDKAACVAVCPRGAQGSATQTNRLHLETEHIRRSRRSRLYCNQCADLVTAVLADARSYHLRRCSWPA